MGGWKLEVGKMALYMFFPVVIFHYFNQPEYFEAWVTKTKRELYPPEGTANEYKIRDAIKQIQEEQEIKMLNALEDNQATA